MTRSPPDGPTSLQDGRYLLREVLGEGGMAIVYRAWDQRLEVDRAIKMLQPAMAARPRVRARFHAEARTMARLSHPHIVSVHDVNAEGDHVYIVMEMMTGGTLWDQVVQRGPMPPRVAIDAVLPALSALAHAHAAGVVHRDVKPQNVLLSGQGVARLTDFGIARVEAADTRTRTAAVMGTWTYMPPEQRNSAKHVDARSDLYAVGAMIWALTHGQEPPDLFAADMDPALLAELPPALAEVVRVATRYQPSARFSDAEHMAAALHACRAQLAALPVEGAARWPAFGALAPRLTSEAGTNPSAPRDPAASTGSAGPSAVADPVATLPPPASGDTLPPVSPSAGEAGRTSSGGPASGGPVSGGPVSGGPVAGGRVGGAEGAPVSSPSRPPPPAPDRLDERASADAAPATMVPLGVGTLAEEEEEEPAAVPRLAGRRLPLLLGIGAVITLVIGFGLQRAGQEGDPSGDVGTTPAAAGAPARPDPAGEGAELVGSAPAPRPAGQEDAAVGVASGAGAAASPEPASSSSPSSPSSSAPPSSAPSSSAPPSSAPPSSAPPSSAPSSGASASSAPSSGASASSPSPSGATTRDGGGSATDRVEAPADASAETANDTVAGAAAAGSTLPGAAVEEPPGEEPTAEPGGAGAGSRAPGGAVAASAGSDDDKEPTPAASAGPGPATATARVTVTGDVTLIKLISKTTGQAYDPGPVPVGDYDLQVRFEGDDDPGRVAEVRVREGWDVVVRCRSRRRVCQQ